MPASFNLQARNNQTFIFTFAFQAGSPPSSENITNWIARFQVRPFLGSPVSLLYLDSSLNTNAPSSIALNGNNGTISIYVPVSVLQQMSPSNSYVYDLVLINPTAAIGQSDFCICAGNFMLATGVTLVGS